MHKVFFHKWQQRGKSRWKKGFFFATSSTHRSGLAWLFGQDFTEAATHCVERIPRASSPSQIPLVAYIVVAASTWVEVRKENENLQQPTVWLSIDLFKYSFWSTGGTCCSSTDQTHCDNLHRNNSTTRFLSTPSILCKSLQSGPTSTTTKNVPNQIFTHSCFLCFSTNHRGTSDLRLMLLLLLFL